MKKIGIELGIRAPMDAIQKAALIADAYNLNYYFVPETNPNFIGVDAFEAIHNLIARRIKKTKLGTAIVNVFSRTKEEILKASENLHHTSSGNFVLGLGTSAPVIVEEMYKIKFKKPLLRIKQYTSYLKKNSKYPGPIYWSAVGDKITELAAQHADGVIFFLKPEEQIKHCIKIIENKLFSIGKPADSFEIISIRPTFINHSEQKAKNAARMTVAAYVGANEFYSEPLIRSGFEKEVSDIRENFKSAGLSDASKKVSDKLIQELTTFGTIKDCQTKLNQYLRQTGVKTMVAGFDLPKDGYNGEFLENLSGLAGGLRYE